MERLLPLVLLVLAALVPAPNAQETEDRLQPPALHLSSFSSMRAARLGADGRLDSGAGVVSIGDGQEDLRVDSLFYGRGPTLVGRLNGTLRGLDVQAAAVCNGLAAGGDERSVVALQLRVDNVTDARVQMPVVLTVHPGAGEPRLRPSPSLALQPETRFGLEDGVITRDGATLLRWLGGNPAVEVFERVVDPWGAAARITFELDIPAGVSRYLEVELAGPSTNPAGDEQAWRQSFLRRTFRDLEETLRWQWQARGRFANFVTPLPWLDRAVVASMHMLRGLGVAYRSASALTDRPFGHPPTDAAVEAEIWGTLMMVNLDEISAGEAARLTTDLDRVLAGLSPERRVAYLYGLVQGLRLGPVNDTYRTVAEAVVEHIETVPVRPWLDPDVVRGDLAAFVTEAGVDGGDDLPSLTWAEVGAADSFDARFQAVRRAFSAGDRGAAWEAFSALLQTSYRGQGSWSEGGELDGRYPVAVLNLVREAFVDDHGDVLQLFPRLSSDFIDRGAELHIDFTPTRFGQIRAQLYAVGRKNVGMWVRSVRGHRDAPLHAYMPETHNPRRLLGKPTGGEATILEDGAIQMWIDQVGSGGLRLSAGVGEIDG